jgi:hypothetical protein
MVESYNILLLNNFQGYYEHERLTERQQHQISLSIDKRAQAVEKAKTELYAQQDMVKSVMLSKDREIAELRSSLALC